MFWESPLKDRLKLSFQILLDLLQLLIVKKPKLFYITTTLTEGMVNGVPYVDKVAEGHKTFELPQDPAKQMANVEERLRRKGYIVDLKKDDSTNQHFIDLEEDNSQEELTENERRGWPHFSRVFMISALTGDGITELRDYVVDRAYPPQILHFHAALTTHS